MPTCSSDVKQGQASGTQDTLESFVLKAGEQSHQVLREGTIPVAAGA